MRRHVLELREFYAQPLGRVVRDMLSRKVAEAWGDCTGQDVLAMGYASPFLDAIPMARRVIAAMPESQGVEVWPAGRANRACLVDELALPFPNALFDRVLMVHGLEEADDPASLVREAARVMAASGRLIVAAVSRGGLWCHAERTPFGHGRPFTRRQLESLVRSADLEPAAWSQALYAPPWTPAVGWADGFEQIGSRLAPGAAGLILLEAVKRHYAVQARPVRVRARVANPLPGVFSPQPVAGREAEVDPGPR